MMEQKPTFEALEQSLAGLVVELPRETGGGAVYADRFGARPGEEFCNTEAFAAAINYCRKNRVGRLVVPKGVYYFKTCGAHAHLMLDDMEDFVLDGQGSEFVFETVHAYLSVRGSHRIWVKDLVLDWNWEKARLASVGTVTKVAEDGSYVECRFPEYEDVPGDMRFSIVGPMDPARFTPGCAGGMEFRPYHNNHVKKSGDAKTDKKMQALVRELSDLFLCRQEKTGPATLRFYTTDAEFTTRHFKKGDCFRFRHYEYDIMAVPILDSTDVTMERITLFSAPGSGFVGNGDIRGLRFHQCRVTVRPGTLRSISTATDCLHVCNSQGNFIIENCEFGYAGDDLSLIHI